MVMSNRTALPKH